MTGSILMARGLSYNISFSTAQMMINRLLTLDRIETVLGKGRTKNYVPDNKPEVIIGAFTRIELAEKLGISLRELKKLGCPYFYKGMASKISLPLNCLYCATKFASGEYKGEQP